MLMNPSRSLQRTLLCLIGASGAAIFSFFFALTFHTPEWVEDFVAGFIEKEVAARVVGIEKDGCPAGDCDGIAPRLPEL